MLSGFSYNQDQTGFFLTAFIAKRTSSSSAGPTPEPDRNQAKVADAVSRFGESAAEKNTG